MADSKTAQTKTDDTEVTPEDQNVSTVITDLESMIKSHITGIDTRKKKLKQLREMIASTLASDSEYKDLEGKAKAAAKEKNARKTEIMHASGNTQIMEQTHDLSTEVKEMDEALSDYLREYQRMTGVNEIETNEGDTREIVYIAKLVKKSSR